MGGEGRGEKRDGAASEATFNSTISPHCCACAGFLSAIFSNITFQSRNVLSKKLMISKGSLDNMNLFQVGNFKWLCGKKRESGRWLG